MGGRMWLPISERCTEAEAARILAKFVQYGDCWEWIGSKDDRGYARCWYRGRNWHITRLIVWIVAGELVPAGCDVAHECHNPGCGAPGHLLPTDATTNRARRAAVYGDPLGWRARRELARYDNHIKAIVRETV